ncbi:MAG TPA: hypothetical protein VGR46_01010, partial [Candidatus Limnocylindria bacterium]|nr:hypothetical protein [Candidatus Limnocylindria bacterium]
MSTGLTPHAEAFGRRYLLNRLEGLVRTGALDQAAADRVRDAVAAELAGEWTAPATPTARPVPPPVLERTPTATVTQARPLVEAAPRAPRGPSLAESFFTPERAPSLLLYVGAFLVVVAALIFVNVSGQQISDSVKLGLMLAGTAGFIAAGLLCHRIPRVEEAGRTFLAIGALLVAVDFAAYYALVARQTPFTSPAMWVIGSFLSAGLYAALALIGYGKGYAYLFFCAALSAVGGLEVWSHLSFTAQGIPFVGLAVVLELLDRAGRGRPLARLAAPLTLPARVLAGMALLFGGVLALFAGAGLAERIALPTLITTGTTYYALRASRGISWERWLAIAGPALIALAVVFAARGPAQTYGFAFAVLAIAYTVGHLLEELAERRTTLPGWARERARIIAFFCVAGAVLPVDAYWRAPAVGATVELAMSALLAVLAVLGARAANRPRVDLDAFVFVSTALLHLGLLFALVRTGILRSGVTPFTGLDLAQVATSFALVATVLGLLAAVARRRALALVPAVSIAAVGSALLVVTLAAGDPMRTTVFAALAATGCVLSAVDARRPRALWAAAGFAAIAGWAGARWLEPPEFERPVACAFAALVLFAPAYASRFRSSEFARVTREIAIVAAMAGVMVGLGFAFARPVRFEPWLSDVWVATAPALAVFGGISIAESLRRRNEIGVVLASASFLGALLMLIARLRPDAIEAYTVPAAVYLALVAWGVSRAGSLQLRSWLVNASLCGAAVALIGPTYVRSWGGDGELRGILVLAESLFVLRFTAGRDFSGAAGVATGALALMVLRASWSPLELEAPAGIAGAALLAMTLLAPRPIPWRIDVRLREVAEVLGTLLLLMPALVRAAASGSDALTQGASVLALGAVTMGLGIWSGRRALISAAGTMLALASVLALKDTPATEPYVAAAGVAILIFVIAIPRFIARPLPVAYEVAIEVLGAAMIVSGSLDRTLRGGDVHAARAL